MEKKYIVRDKNNNLHLIGSSYKPKNYVAEAPMDELTSIYEDPKWLKVVSIVDEFGNESEGIEVDLELKASIQAQDLQNKLEIEAANAIIEQKDRDLKLKLKNLNPDQILNMADIRDAIGSILEHINKQG